MISSTSNAQVKEVLALQSKAKARCESGFFVVEGLRLVREARPEDIDRLYMTEAFALTEEGRRMAASCRFETVTDTVMQHMADTRTPQGILAVVRMHSYDIRDLMGGPLLVLENVQDPGNVGTLFRTAEAAGASGILMNEGTADPWQPKVVRSTMGAIFRLPFVKSGDLAADILSLKEAGYCVYAAHLQGKETYDGIIYPEKAAFLLGNEGNGLTDETASLADEKVLIPMAGKTESLNVSVAGAVLIFEHFRQKRRFGRHP